MDNVFHILCSRYNKLLTCRCDAASKAHLFR